MLRSLLVLCGTTLLFGVLEPLRADILFDNLGNTPGSVLGTFPIGTFNPAGGGGDGPEGDSFSTGASPFLLTDVTLKLQGVHDSDSFNVTLYSDNDTVCAPGPTCSGGPLTALYTIAADFSDNSLSTSLADHDFSLASPQTLAANTRYWIIASSTDNSGTLWSYTQDLSGVGVASEFNETLINAAGGNILEPNSDDSVNNAACFTGPSESNVCTPFQMEVAGDTVPEPSSLLLLATAILLLFLCGAKLSAKYTARIGS